MKRAYVVGAAAWLLSASLASLAWSKKKPKAEPPPPVAAEMQVEGTVGELDDGAVQRVLQANHGAMRRCYDEQAGRLHYVGGHLELKVRVLPSGQPKWVPPPKAARVSGPVPSTSRPARPLALGRASASQA
jgi:hypothetical protein